MARHNQIGQIGEYIASKFLERKGLKILTKNYRKPYGEIDIVSRERSGKYRFIEVKTVSRETGSFDSFSALKGSHRPEENVHPMKVRRLMHVIEAYIVSHEIDADWQFDVVAVYLDEKKKIAKVRHLENVVLGS